MRRVVTANEFLLSCAVAHLFAYLFIMRNVHAVVHKTV